MISTAGGGADALLLHREPPTSSTSVTGKYQTMPEHLPLLQGLPGDGYKS